MLGKRGRGADVPSGCVGRCGPVPSPRTQTRTTTMPATAWCCTWTPEMKCMSSWMEAKHTEATTISTALSLAFFYTLINTQVTRHTGPATDAHGAVWQFHTPSCCCSCWCPLPQRVTLASLPVCMFLFSPLWKRNRNETK